MVLAAYKDLCLDAADAHRVGSFWAAALGQPLTLLEDGDTVVREPRLGSLWVNAVPEPKTVKNRVHLDVYAPSLDALLDLGAIVQARHEVHTVVGDPEGNELCVFPEPEPDRGDGTVAAARVFALCVDSARPVDLAEWWQSTLGGELGPGPDGVPRYLHGGSGFGDITMKFVPVADERAVKNRCHWDVTTDDLDALVAAGATVVRPQDDQIRWAVLADPQGNEFCAFT